MITGKTYLTNGLVTDADIGEKYGAALLKGSYEALLTPAGIKDNIKTNHRLLHGSVIVNPALKMASRDVTLIVFIEGASELDYLTKLKDFMAAITAASVVQLSVAPLRTTYSLSYKSSASYGNYGLKRGKLSITFEEPDPTARTEFVPPS